MYSALIKLWAIRAFKKAALDLVGPLPQPALQSMFDALYPPGLQRHQNIRLTKRRKRSR